jgi:hypothetical protein
VADVRFVAIGDSFTEGVGDVLPDGRERGWADIAAQGYDLSLNRYKEVVHAEVAHRPPGEILAKLAELEVEIQRGMKELEGMLK